MIKYLCAFIISFIFSVSSFSQEQITGLFVKEEGASDHYTFYAPFSSRNCYLIDECGYLINEWEGYTIPGLSAHFMDNGNILRTYKAGDHMVEFQQTSAGGTLEILDWDNETVWEYDFTTPRRTQHHEIEMMPNGNIMVLTWEKVLASETEALGKIETNFEVWTEALYEIKPVGSNDIEIVWEWHLTDHLIQDYDSTKLNYGVVRDNVGLVDVNYQGPFWLGFREWWHCNAIDYNEELDQVLISSRNNGEVWVIDHSTTSEEAAGHTGGNSGKGGDLIFRWGNPEAYQAGGPEDYRMFGAHGTHWVEEGLDDEGAIVFFNNGRFRPEGDFSTIDLIRPGIDNDGNYVYDGKRYLLQDSIELYGTDAEPEFFSQFLSNTQQLENGNLFINEGGNGRLFEVNANKEIVWQYVNPASSFIFPQFGSDPSSGGGSIFQAFKIPRDHPGLSDKDLTPGDLIESNPMIDLCKTLSSSEITSHSGVGVQMNYLQHENQLEIMNTLADGELTIHAINGKHVFSKVIDEQFFILDLSFLNQGSYIATVRNQNQIYNQKIMKL